MTSDNQPTQSFDDRLREALTDNLINGDYATSSIEGYDEAITAIKAAIRDSRPDGYPETDLTTPAAILGYNAALDEWSKNMNLEDK